MRFGVAAAFAAIAAFPTAAAEPDMPTPLPPPPELLDDAQAIDPVEETRRALEPPERVTVPPRQAVAPAPVVAAPVRAVPAAPATFAVTPAPVAAGMRISPPSRFMPEDYFNLPLDDEGVPGVVMPELDEDFYEPPPEWGVSPQYARIDRPVERGMTVRQLEPYFALAKGSEGAALEAKERGDDAAFRDQLVKAVAAYMEIITMADAGTEAREESWYGVARCEYRLERWWRAFDALERSFPRQYERDEVAGRVKLEMFIGERLWRMGASPVPDTAQDGVPLTGYQAASRVYAAAIFNQPATNDTPLALLRRGDAAALESDWPEAAKYYRQVVEYFPESEPAMLARSSLTEAIYRQDWPAGFPEAARDDVASIMDDVERSNADLSEEAAQRRQRAVALANDKEAETKLRHAKEYLKSLRVRKSRDAAVFLLGDVVSLYPGTSQAAEAADLLRGMGIEPPMQLSDGTHFPITSGWSGRERDDQADPGFFGGSAVLEGQNNSYEGVDPAYER